MNDVAIEAGPGKGLDWSLVQVFLALLQAGSLGRAAKTLGLSQPTLSRRLASLEASLGQALFERTAHGLVPTAAGSALRGPAEGMREQAGQLARAAAQRTRVLAGSVRITASETVSAHVLLPILRRVRERHPEIQIELVPSDAVQDLLQRDADIAVRMFRPLEPSLIVRRMADMPLGLYAHRSYLARRGAPTLDRADAHEWIGFDRSEVQRRGFAAGGYPVAREFFAFRCDSSLLNWHAVCAGLGIGVGLQAVAATAPGVERVLPEAVIPPLPVWLTVHRELRGTPRLKLVFDLLAEALRAR